MSAPIDTKPTRDKISSVQKLIELTGIGRIRRSRYKCPHEISPRCQHSSLLQEPIYQLYDDTNEHSTSKFKGYYCFLTLETVQ